MKRREEMNVYCAQIQLLKRDNTHDKKETDQSINMPTGTRKDSKRETDGQYDRYRERSREVGTAGKIVGSDAEVKGELQGRRRVEGTDPEDES